ncbi:hypothetical protein O6H91_07G120300 [Diphasiastrum complanatum]|uniref:Uncharacterized protein n=2 Tax=Diphasiastrum complanatum TaxID=34168 RepID=A0ACC2D907_DIPCM|nr:hypothetical protein O6H91_07G120300 [Diphasiastrum complanatum]
MIWHFDMMLNILRIVLGVLGNLTATAFFISPMSTFVIICRKRDTQSFSGVSYLASMFNCILWVWYGMPFITKNNILLLSINALGATLESVYISLFITFAPRKEKLKALSTVLLELMLFSVIATLSLLIIPPTKKELFVGSISAVITTLMYAAPLSIMRMVIETKSVEFMPFWPSFLVIINSTIWLFYGLFGRDFFVLVTSERHNGSILEI